MQCTWSFNRDRNGERGELCVRVQGPGAHSMEADAVVRVRKRDGNARPVALLERVAYFGKVGTDGEAALYRHRELTEADDHRTGTSYRSGMANTERARYAQEAAEDAGPLDDQEHQEHPGKGSADLLRALSTPEVVSAARHLVAALARALEVK